MAKEITARFTLVAPGAQATPGPPIGPTLGSKGVPPGPFIKQFNDKSKEFTGMMCKVKVTLYKDKTFDMEISPMVSALLLSEAKISKGSGSPNKEKVGKISRSQVRKIAQFKMKDMNAYTIDAAERQVLGTARNMGIEIVEK